MGIIIVLILFVCWIGFNYYIYKNFGKGDVSYVSSADEDRKTMDDNLENMLRGYLYFIYCLDGQEKVLKEGIDFVWSDGGYRVDPKDNDPKYKDILHKAWLEAEAALEVPCKWPDFVFETPKLQKKILKEKYGINYYTTEELNPEKEGERILALFM